MAQRVMKDEVRDFWSRTPCDSYRSTEADRKRYFEDVERWRYEEHPSIPEMAHFGDYRGCRVLEIGCGLGTDGRQFAMNGAAYTGVNLDEGSTRLAREAFEVFELPGEILQMDGEALEFESAVFDHLYAMGVLMATPNPNRMLSEAFRVLRPGGTIRVMVYNKWSVNYVLEIMFLRKLLRLALWPRSGPRVMSMLTGSDEAKLTRHREIMRTEKMTHARWVSINTDGPDCPLSDVYTARQIARMFEAVGFSEVGTCVRFFNRGHYGRLGNLIPVSVADRIGKLWGWHLWVEARKAPAGRQ